MRPLGGVVVAHDRVEWLQASVDTVDAALLEDEPGHRQNDRLPRSPHRRQPVATGRLAGDDHHRITHRSGRERAPVECGHACGAKDERGNGDAGRGHPQAGRVPDEQRRDDEEGPAERGDGEADRRRHDQPGVPGHNVTRPCSAASRAGPMPLTWSSSSSDRNPPCSVR